jgi:alkane 1-monooxygenase
VSISKRNINYLWALFPSVLVIAGNFLGGGWSLLNTIFTLAVLGLLEIILPQNTSNNKNDIAILPDAILKLAVVFQTLSLASLFIAIYTEHLTGAWIYVAAFSTGVNSGTLAIVTAHEMIHRKDKFWQRAGKYQLFSVGNIYFYNEHLFVHHKLVGTDKDPASARKGESYYAFSIRSILGQLKGAWKIEKERLAKKGKNLFSGYNYMGLSGVLLLILTIGFAAIRLELTLAFILQGFVANLLLEYTNYIEHYGLQRDEKTRVTEIHSWQTDKVISRFFLIDLSRHADHHFHAAKPYHTLESYQNSPLLPGGYASMFFAALIPPLWFKLLDNRIPFTTK